MNFITAFNEGQANMNVGLTTGIDALDTATNGIQRKSIYTIGAGPKVGKSTLVDYAFVLSPYKDIPNSKAEIDWIYLSYEVDIVSKMYKYAAHYFYDDYNISHFTYKGKEHLMSANYLLGKLKDADKKLILIKKEHKKMLKDIYFRHIIPIFGDYNKRGVKLKKGVIDFIEQRSSPSGIRNYLLNYAENNGEFIKEQYTTRVKGKSVKKYRIVGYIPHNPRKYVIIITDHMRKLKGEYNYSRKERIDKLIEYQVELRNWCGFIFVDIIHLNRALDDVKRMQYNGEFLHPTGADFKDTGNLSEEANYIISIMNPSDEKYRLTKHFGIDLMNNNLPNYRSLHLIESRDTECPVHLQTEMFGNISVFQPLKVNN